MIRSRKYTHELINKIPDREYVELIDFLKFLKRKSRKNEFKSLEDASYSSTSFWDNDIDDGIWNDV